MKRYIRTKDGKIYDTHDFSKCYIGIHERAKYDLPESIPNAIKQADTIEELIMVGDLYTILLLIDMGEAIVEETYEIKNESDLKDFMECVRMGDIAVNKLYTKQGNDYILVAEKENGEWRVI